MNELSAQVEQKRRFGKRVQHANDVGPIGDRAYPRADSRAECGSDCADRRQQLRGRRAEWSIAMDAERSDGA